MDSQIPPAYTKVICDVLTYQDKVAASDSGRGEVRHTEHPRDSRKRGRARYDHPWLEIGFALGSTEDARGKETY
jgi:hypothetical protein